MVICVQFEEEKKNGAKKSERKKEKDKLRDAESKRSK